MTKIEWTEQTWNPVVGCSLASPGCTNCYAMKMAARLDSMDAAAFVSGGRRPRMQQYSGVTKFVNKKAVWTGKVAIVDDHALMAPMRRKKPTMYFVNSMGDLFHEAVPDEWIDSVFAVMALCPQHTFQVLTKRAARMRDYFKGQMYERVGARMGEIGGPEREGWYAPACDGKRGWLEVCAPLPNVWLGVSVENQARANERIPDLLATLAAVRFVSCEPMLGELDLGEWLGVERITLSIGRHWTECTGRVAKLDQVICGGESGSGARPMHPDWARSLRDQCTASGVPFFFKQWGEWAEWPDSEFISEIAECEEIAGRYEYFQRHSADAPVHMRRVGKKAAGRLLDGCTWDEMPKGLPVP